MRVVDLFCGAGGMSLGLKMAGFEVIKAYDSWPVAVSTYRDNIGDHAEVVDLTNLIEVVPEICRIAPDLICGGPPCQDYSVAGRREEGRNASMTLGFTIAVVSSRPEWFLMENVVQAARSETWSQARAMLVKAGYGLSEVKLTASHYGIPQNRRRFFVVGRLGERDGFLQSAIGTAASPRPMSLRDFFS